MSLQKKICPAASSVSADFSVVYLCNMRVALCGKLAITSIYKKLSYMLVYPGRYFNTFPALSDHFKFINDSATALYAQMAQRDRG